MSFKENYFFNSTIMASFLPVIVSKKNKQTEKNMSFFCSVSQIHINPEKTTLTWDRLTGLMEYDGTNESKNNRVDHLSN